MKGQLAILVAIFAGSLGGKGTSGAEVKSSIPDSIRVGIVGTLFRDAPEPLVLKLMEPFGKMMQEQTGIKGKLSSGGSALDLGKKLDEGKVELGLFSGIEFAWAQQKYPDLRPLMLVVNQDRHLRALLVVRQNAGFKSFADLKGKSLTIPLFSHEHCYQFLKRECQESGLEPEAYFSKISRATNAEEALDNVIDGQIQVALVEGIHLECYKRRKPGRFTNLAVTIQSEVFPAGVIAYRAGSLNESTLGNLRKGIATAPENPVGRQLLTLWKMTGFEPIPADYQENLAHVAKEYPPPPPGTR